MTTVAIVPLIVVVNKNTDIATPFTDESITVYIIDIEGDIHPSLREYFRNRKLIAT